MKMPDFTENDTMKMLNEVPPILTVKEKEALTDLITAFELSKKNIIELSDLDLAVLCANLFWLGKCFSEKQN